MAAPIPTGLTSPYEWVQQDYLSVSQHDAQHGWGSQRGFCKHCSGAESSPWEMIAVLGLSIVSPWERITHRGKVPLMKGASI